MNGPGRRHRWTIRWRCATSRAACCSPVRFALVTQKALTAAARKIDEDIEDNAGYPPFDEQQ